MLSRTFQHHHLVALKDEELGVKLFFFQSQVAWQTHPLHFREVSMGNFEYSYILIIRAIANLQIINQSCAVEKSFLFHLFCLELQ
jgi:hypothetical protein